MSDYLIENGFKRGDQLPLWKSRQSEKVESKVSVVSGASVPAGSCEFVGAKIDDLVDGRYCFDGTFCPKKCYSDFLVFALCPARLEKLKLKKKEQT